METDHHESASRSEDSMIPEGPENVVAPAALRSAAVRASPTSPILRWILLVGSALLVVDALAHGPGRGIWMVNSKSPLIDYLYFLVFIGTYLSFLAAAVLCKNSASSLPSKLLGVGLIGRSFLEYSIQVGKSVFSGSHLPAPGVVAFVLCFYLVSFVVPFLVFFDCLRAIRTRSP